MGKLYGDCLNKHARSGDDADKVVIESEYQLFCEPMRADVVIIKKDAGVVLNNAVMKHFETHNIIEMKSPRDTLNMKGFDKTMAAYLSEKGYESKRPPMTLGDQTATLISVRRPRKMMAALCEKRSYKFIKTLNAVIAKYEAIINARKGRGGGRKGGAGDVGDDDGDTDLGEVGNE